MANSTRRGGDLVFSRSGELLGVMANGIYCMMLDNFNAAGVAQMKTGFVFTLQS